MLSRFLLGLLVTATSVVGCAAPASVRGLSMEVHEAAKEAKTYHAKVYEQLDKLAQANLELNLSKAQLQLETEHWKNRFKIYSRVHEAWNERVASGGGIRPSHSDRPK